MPLLRARRLRALIAAGLAVGAIAPTGVVLLSFAWLSAPLLLVVALAVFLASPFMARAMVDGRWAGGVSVAATVLTAGVYAVLAVVAARLAIQAGATRDTLGTSSLVAASWLGVLAGCGLALAGLVAAVPLPVSRRVGAAAVVGGIAAALIGAGAAGATARHDTCRDFRFDRVRWQRALSSQGGDGKALAAAVARCHTFAGASRVAVRRALGPANGSEAWTWVVGSSGFGDMGVTELRLMFGPDARVRGARVVHRTI